MASEKETADLQLAAGQILIYRDGAVNLQVRLDGETVWLTQAQIAELFQTTPQNITLHIAAIYGEGELIPEATCKDYLQVQTEGNRQVRRSLKHYNLDMILAVGYRVRSPRGTQFRQWATARLGELLVKGFTLDDERIKAGRTLGAGLLRRTAGAHSRHPLERAPLLPEDHRYLRHQHRLRPQRRS